MDPAYYGTDDRAANDGAPRSVPEVLDNGFEVEHMETAKIEDEKAVVQQEPKSPKHPRLTAMYTTSDWWSMWIGLLSFGLASLLVFTIPHEKGSTRARYIIPQPMSWTSNPLDAWDLYGIVLTLLLMVVLGCFYLFALYFMGKFKKNSIVDYVVGFTEMCVVAILAFWIGRQTWCSSNGLGYAIWSILFGMVIANVSPKDSLPALKMASKDGEFFIKCSLVLLAVEFSVLGEVGLPAIVVSWIGSPLSLLAAYHIGTRLFKMDVGLSLLIACGATWCGASAISAIGSVIGSSSQDISLSISIVAAATVLFTFLQPYFAILVGMDDRVAGAWIGGSVDQTGNVIASAAIISEEATEVAGIVKIILNSGLGILASIVACWWEARKKNEAEEGSRKRIGILFLWDKFPKFVLGYVICSGILSIILPRIKDTAESESYTRAVSSLNKWWFAIAFVGIGVGTNIKELWEGAVKSGVIKLYFIANAIDIVLALGLAFLVF